MEGVYMIIDKDEWKKLTDTLGDLFWEVDRKSSSGEASLKYISKVVERIEKSKTNNVYSIYEHGACDDEKYHKILGATSSLDKAKKILKDGISNLKTDVDFDNLEAKDINEDLDDYDNEWLYENNDNSFTLYLNGCANSDYHSISISEIVMDNEKQRDNRKEKER